MTKLLIILLLITFTSSEPRRVPKIYNAVITSSENLEPSRAYPIVQPVFRPAAVAYQVQVPYVPQPQEIASVPLFGKQNTQPNSYPANIGLNGNQVKIEPNVGPNGVTNPSNDISPAGTYIQSQQAFGNLYQNQPSQAHGFVSIHTYPPNVSPNISPNIAQNIIQNLAQTIQHNGQNLPLTLSHNLQENSQHVLNRQQNIPYIQHTETRGQQIQQNQQSVTQNLPNVQQSVPNHQQTVPNHQQSIPSHQQSISRNQQSVPFEQQSIQNQPSVISHPQSYLNRPNLQQSVPNQQRSVQNLQQSVQNLHQSVSNQQQNVPNLKESVPNHQQSVPNLQQSVLNLQQSVPNLQQTVPSLQQSVPNLQQSVQPQEAITYQQVQPSVQYQDHILNNNHRDRTIPDVPPPPLPTAKGRLPAERPPPPPSSQ